MMKSLQLSITSLQDLISPLPDAALLWHRVISAAYRTS
ncbi:hypothetical protein CAter282_0010 [Collimonas arenae]|uniref:Uncharacterized protein n=1 Tax=Collimonas arenae TaxID=279058 RepID=A0A127PJH4_9BURK|nr:hypothetical protein CAter10_0011 [Collimonas arenae]AMP07834.1 hypothetical protein CAter282_0010 [Collimonas arenae]